LLKPDNSATDGIGLEIPRQAAGAAPACRHQHVTGRMTMPTAPIDTIRNFYAALAAGDAASALGLMSADIEWLAMWSYKANRPGPQGVAEGVFVPLQRDWKTFEIVPSEYLAEGDGVLSIGRFRGVHGATGKSADAGYAHLWTVRDGRITRFRQFIDTLAIAQAGQ
jgi:ketosteroid isomerase-like protein